MQANAVVVRFGRSRVEDESQRRLSMKRLTRDEAFLIAVTIAKLPSVPRQILKDIPSRRLRPAGTIEARESNDRRNPSATPQP
jgi:hypothetical protein